MAFLLILVNMVTAHYCRAEALLGELVILAALSRCNYRHGRNVGRAIGYGCYPWVAPERESEKGDGGYLRESLVGIVSFMLGAAVLVLAYIRAGLIVAGCGATFTLIVSR
jgi:hypothetical protein